MIEVITGKVGEQRFRRYVEYKTSYGHKIRCNLFNSPCHTGDNVVGYLTESNKPVEQNDYTIFGRVIKIGDDYIHLNNGSEIIKMNKQVLHTKIKRDFNVIAYVTPDDLSVEEIARPVLKFVNTHMDELIPAPYWDTIKLEDVLSETRKRHIVFTRHLIIFLYAIFTNNFVKAIGKTFDKDHTSILHSKKVILQELSINKILSSGLQQIVDGCNRTKPLHTKKFIYNSFNTCMV